LGLKLRWGNKEDIKGVPVTLCNGNGRGRKEGHYIMKCGRPIDHGRGGGKFVKLLESAVKCSDMIPSIKKEGAGKKG